MKRFDSELPKALAFKEATKETPAANPLPYALVPAILAASAILVVFIAAGLVAVAFGWSIRVPLGAAGTVALALFIYAALNIDLIPYTIETITGQDLNRDGGEPPPTGEPWRIILERDTGGELWLNFDSEEMRQKAQIVAAFVLNGSPFSEKALSGTGRPLTHSEFYTLRDLYMFHGLLEWKDPKHPTLGLRWTAPGRSMVRALAGESTTSLRMSGPRSSGYALPPGVGEGDGGR